MNTIILSVLEFGQTVRKNFSDCISFNFIKERYSPYSTFCGSFFINQTVGEIIDIEVTVNSTTIHKGVIDNYSIKTTSKGTVLSVTSRGYTSALGYNELQSEIKYGVTLGSLMTGNYTIPYVTYETSTKTANYLYIKEHSSLWDAVVNLCLKVEKNYPYISYSNNIRFTKPTNPKSLVFDSMDKFLYFSDNSDLSKVISHIHMRDLDGNYNTYNAQNPFAISRNIIRHKHISYDRQWTSMTDLGLSYKINYTMRGHKGYSLLYKGFQGEDINDRFTVNAGNIALSNVEISAVQIFGNKKGIFTKLTAYRDNYCNVSGSSNNGA